MDKMIENEGGWNAGGGSWIPPGVSRMWFFLNCHSCGRKLRQAPFLTGYKHLWCHQASSIHLGFRIALHFSWIEGWYLKAAAVAYPVPVPSRHVEVSQASFMLTGTTACSAYSTLGGAQVSSYFSTGGLFKGIVPALPVFSLGSVPYTVLTYSRSLKHHQPWRWHLGKRFG